MVRLNTSLAPIPEKLLKPFVLEGFDHAEL
jgi:hypothetical protein